LTVCGFAVGGLLATCCTEEVGLDDVAAPIDGTAGLADVAPVLGDVVDPGDLPPEEHPASAIAAVRAPTPAIDRYHFTRMLPLPAIETACFPAGRTHVC
jgi:hypothetical protein